MFSLTVELVSNPDRDRTDWSETKTFSAPTMKELREQIAPLRHEFGGGNWGEATLSQDGQFVGYMSYNGRIWKNKYWERFTIDSEVILPDDEF